MEPLTQDLSPGVQPLIQQIIQPFKQTQAPGWPLWDCPEPNWFKSYLTDRRSINFRPKTCTCFHFQTSSGDLLTLSRVTLIFRSYADDTQLYIAMSPEDSKLMTFLIVFQTLNHGQQKTFCISTRTKLKFKLSVLRLGERNICQKYMRCLQKHQIK